MCTHILKFKCSSRTVVINHRNSSWPWHKGNFGGFSWESGSQIGRFKFLEYWFFYKLYDNEPFWLIWKIEGIFWNMVKMMHRQKEKKLFENHWFRIWGENNFHKMHVLFFVYLLAILLHTNCCIFVNLFKITFDA